MTIEQLFHVEDFLNINRCENVHVAIEAESTIKEAFGETCTIDMDDVKVKGLYIIIFTEDDDDARDIRKSLETIFSLDENEANWYVYRDLLTADLRIAIEVERYK
jgi:hypothetical protein